MTAAIGANGGVSGLAASARADARLSGVTRTLAGSQLPEMPSELAARVDRALAAESARRAADGSMNESQQESAHGSTA